MLDELRQIYIGQHETIKLTEKETLLLKCVLDNWKYKCATYEEIGRYIWGNLIPEECIRKNVQTIKENLNKKLKDEFQIIVIKSRGIKIV